MFDSAILMRLLQNCAEKLYSLDEGLSTPEVFKFVAPLTVRFGSSELGLVGELVAGISTAGESSLSCRVEKTLRKTLMDLDVHQGFKNSSP